MVLHVDITAHVSNENIIYHLVLWLFRFDQFLKINYILYLIYQRIFHAVGLCEPYVSVSGQTDVEIAQHVSRWTQRLLPPKCKTPLFSTPHWSSSVEFGITEYLCRLLRSYIAKTPTYPVVC